MKVRIEADGTLFGTKVFTADGTDITNGVEAVRFSQKGGDLPRVELDICFVSAVALCSATLHHAQPGGERKAIRRIEYVDGTVFEPGADESKTREHDDGA